jgi:class 3 adenylate cyclase
MSGADKKVFSSSRNFNWSSMALRVIRIIRLIRIVKLYRAFVVIKRNRENKKIMRKKMIKIRDKIKKIEEAKKKDEERSSKKNITRGITRMNTGGNNIRSSGRPSQGPAKFNPILENSGEQSQDQVNKSWKKQDTFEEKKKQQDIELKQKALMEFQKKEGNRNEEDYEFQAEESKISKVIAESITQKIILVILFLLFISPLTDEDVYEDIYGKYNYDILCVIINNVYAVYGNIDVFNETLTEFYRNGTDPLFPILNITRGTGMNAINIFPDANETLYSTYRVNEMGLAYSTNGDTQIFYSAKLSRQYSAIINLARTLFTICVLFYMAYLLEEDSRKYVLNPLKVMIEAVESVAMDPVNFKNIESLRGKVKFLIDKLIAKDFKGGKATDMEGTDYEIKIMTLAVVKISALLAIGLGEAGGEILKENLGTREGLNPMLAGKKKMAIFGFCDIRGFPDINVALQEKTMVFVNEIADVVHSCVDKFGGAANKNIGDAFLMVWKFMNSNNTNNNSNTNNFNLDPSDKNIRYVADGAVLGFLSVIKKVRKNYKILQYKQNKDIKAKYGEKFKVQMGFGLHLGWGIEGAIGSLYKIDCSYLSPNVNISARLEGATRQYGVTILLSGELYKLLSNDIKNICRLIDVVTVKGSINPIELYTIHVNDQLKPGREKRRNMSMKDKRKYYNIKKSKLFSDYTSKKGSLGDVVLNKRGFKELLSDKRRPQLFHEKFREGFNHYISGKWEDAFSKFRDALFLDPTDGPTKTLFNYIKSKGKKAPDNWSGYRELTSK